MQHVPVVTIDLHSLNPGKYKNLVAFCDAAVLDSTAGWMI